MFFLQIYLVASLRFSQFACEPPLYPPPFPFLRTMREEIKRRQKSEAKDSKQTHLQGCKDMFLAKYAHQVRCFFYHKPAHNIANSGQENEKGTAKGTQRTRANNAYCILPSHHFFFTALHKPPFLPSLPFLPRYALIPLLPSSLTSLPYLKIKVRRGGGEAGGGERTRGLGGAARGSVEFARKKKPEDFGAAAWTSALAC